MKHKIFDDFVNSQISKKNEIVDLDWSKQRDEWIECVSSFYAQVESFLKQYVSKGQIQVNYETKKITEEYIGEYEVKTANIRLGKNKIKLDPIGTNLIGAKGRVDMIGSNGKVKFVLVDKDSPAPKMAIRVWVNGQEPPHKEKKKREIEWAWKISTPPPGITYIELNKESFFEALMGVANA